MTDDDGKAITEHSKDKRIGDRIITTIAPSVLGHTDIERALALPVWRSVQESPGEAQGHRRLDINVLLCGDPGTAKSSS